jgi:hypothetical protein
MARRVTPADIVEFHRLYAKYGTYARAAEYTDFSASTVARYIKLGNVPKVISQTWEGLMTAAHGPTLKAE